MTNNHNEPIANDAVLGGQSPPPATDAVLGGLEGLKQRLSSSLVEVRLAAFSEALSYGQVGVDLIAQIAKTQTGQVQSAYTVFVDDNYHYQDESERYKLGVFEDGESAVAACKKIVDEFLVQNYSVGMKPENLYKTYTMFGEDPFIISDTPKSLFSAWNYAKQRCNEICVG